MLGLAHFDQFAHRAQADQCSSSEELHVVERFTPLGNGDLKYEFTVNDPKMWSAPWSGEYTWRAEGDSKVYEYACHEGNYSMGGILRGARLLESEAKGAVAGGGD